MKKQSSHNRHMTSKNSILVLVMLVCIFLSTWAWFASGSMDASATGLSANTQTPSTLQMALPDANGNAPELDSAYSSSINFNEKIDIIRTMSSDVTSDGLYFIKPSTTQSNGERTVVLNAPWSKAVANEEYVSIPFYVRSENPNIFVSGNSKLEATLRDEKGKLVNESDVKGISRNAIVGAMRISIVDITKSLYSDEETFRDFKPDTTDLKLTWIPRPDLLLNTPTNTGWTLTQNVPHKELKPDELETIINPTYVHGYCSIDANAEEKYTSYYGAGSGSGVKKTQNPDAVYSVLTENGVTPTLGQDVKIGNGNLTSEIPMTMKNMNGKDYYLYKFVMNIWVEGEDTEARRALNNGEFDLDIKFKAGTT